MSGRAVRKALRQRELEQQQKAVSPDHESEEEEDTFESPPKPKPSLFSLLGGEDEEADEAASENEEDDADELPVESKPAVATKSKKKNKKKKKKDKGKEEAAGTEVEDEIDRALRQLSVKSSPNDAIPEEDQRPSGTDLPGLLTIDSRNFDAGNEMRRLFGKAAISGEEESPARWGGPAGRRGRMMIPGAAGGRGITGGRKNIFIQPKEEWPNVGSGGLGMEIVSDEDSMSDPHAGVTEFRFVHSRAYQDVQRQFMMCVASMDPDRLIQLLQMNPYHISTLLQVSEILTHQRDHSQAGDLLQRVLFSFGRSLHSTFPLKLAEGKARLSFRRPENREFFLGAWRYIQNICMRGTYRTALEWARMLLSMDPLDDPYQICLLIDFLALKARQPELLIALAEHPSLEKKYSALPNIAFSAALAYQQAEKPQLAAEYLAKAITKFPWIPAMLYREVGIDENVPTALWGTVPPEENIRQRVLAQLYVERSKDLWKEPDAGRLLVSAASTIYNLPRRPLLKDAQEDVDFDLARHVLLTDIPAITTLLPREITRREDIATYDPLPPEDNLRSYNPTPVLRRTGGGGIDANAGGAVSDEQRSAIMEFIRSMLPWADGGTGEEGGREPGPGNLPDLTPAQLQELNRFRDAVENGDVDFQQLLRDENQRVHEERREEQEDVD